MSEKIAKNSVVFAYVGTDIDSLWSSFEKVAKTMYTELTFISVHPNLIDVSTNCFFTPNLNVTCEKKWKLVTNERNLTVIFMIFKGLELFSLKLCSLINKKNC